MKKVVFAFKKDKKSQSLSQFVTNLKTHLDASPKKFESIGTKRDYSSAKLKKPKKKETERAYTPIYQRSAANDAKNIYKKKKPKKPKAILFLTIAAVCVSVAIIVLLAVIFGDGKYGKNALQSESRQKNIASLFKTEDGGYYILIQDYLISDSIKPIKQDNETPAPEISLKYVARMGDICQDEPLQTQPGSENSPEPTAAVQTTPAPYATLDISQVEFSQDVLIHKNDIHEKVPAIQERLMDLNYMDADEPTDTYGEVTSYAMQLFQRNHDLMVDGVAGYASLTLLFSEEAKPYMVREGDYGFDIYMINKRLIELGYLDGDDSGKNFTEETDYAVRVFQGRNKLLQDGIVGYNTTQVLFNGDAKPAKNYSQPSDGGSSSSGGGSDGGSYNPNDANALVSYAKAQMGKGYTYIWGGKGPPGMDCSGFVYYSLKQTGNGIGYMTSAAWAQSSYTSISSIHDAKPGDILCFEGHVAICIGGGKMIDSSSSQNGIRITNYESSSYWNKKWICAKRVFS